MIRISQTIQQNIGSLFEIEALPIIRTSIKERGFLVIIVVLISIFSLGSNFVYELPTTLGTKFEKYFGVDEGTIDATYSYHFLGSTIGALVGLFVMERYHLGISAIGLTFFVFLSSTFVSYAVYIKSLALYSLFQGVAGLFSSALEVIQLTACGTCLFGNIMTFGFSMIEASSSGVRLFSYITSGFVFRLFYNYPFVFMYGSYCAIIAITGAMGYVFIEQDLKSNLNDDVTIKFNFDLTKRVGLASIAYLGKPFWTLAIILCCLEACSAVFDISITDYLEIGLGMESEAALTMQKMVYIWSIIGAIFFGIIITIIGKRSLFMIIASLVMLLGYISMAIQVSYFKNQNTILLHYSIAAIAHSRSILRTIIFSCLTSLSLSRALPTSLSLSLFLSRLTSSLITSLTSLSMSSGGASLPALFLPLTLSCSTFLLLLTLYLFRLDLLSSRLLLLNENSPEAFEAAQQRERKEGVRDRLFEKQDRANEDFEPPTRTFQDLSQEQQQDQYADQDLAQDQGIRPESHVELAEVGQNKMVGEGAWLL